MRYSTTVLQWPSNFPEKWVHFASLLCWLSPWRPPGRYGASSCPMTASSGFRWSPGHAASGNSLCIALAQRCAHQNGPWRRCICSPPPSISIAVTKIIAKDHIMEEIGRLGIKLVNGEGNESIIMPEKFKHFWRKVNEFTSSSMSGVHYSHYVHNVSSTEILARQLTVIARSGIPPESWSVGLQVMLEKIAGVCLVKKLQAIQFYEADFNCYNQFIFGKQAMITLTESRYIPKELFSQNGSTSEDTKFDKTLMADLSRQARHPMPIISADAAYGYDRANHVIMSLVWLVLTKGNVPAIVAAMQCLPDNEILPTNGIWWVQNLFWRPTLLPPIWWGWAKETELHHHPGFS